MGSSSPKDHPAFGFTDLHGFKDFVSMVTVCAPDLFMPYDWLGPDEQLNLGLAFDGLRYGLYLASQEKGESMLLSQSRSLVEEAFTLYQAGQDHAGQLKLEEVEKLIAKLPSR
ncbi:MAG: trigger factor [Planctomycetia bacterium]|nr:trigger factor [Planctomycetia bacterium]